MTNKTTNLLDLVEVTTESRIDMCRCSDCQTDFMIDDLEWKMDSDGWEYPSYKMYLCPNCPDGVGLIEDFWSSEDVDD